VRSAAPVRPLNPLLAAVPLAEPELIRRAGFTDHYEGMVVCGGAKCCGLGRDTLLVRDTARSYTLIHEFVQSLLRPLCLDEPDDTVEARFGAAYRRMTLYQRRLLDDPYKLLDPLWRRDILAAQAGVAADLFDRIRLGQSQEAIVEKLLGRLIEECSPYFDADRRAQGLRYGEDMVNAAIDLFNEVNDSVVFVQETIGHLRQALRDGDIAPGDRVSLVDDDVAAAARAGRDIEAQLAKVRAELKVLKQFYSR
jgi:hypothetical protein